MGNFSILKPSIDCWFFQCQLSLINPSFIETLKRYLERQGDCNSPSKDYINQNKSIISHWGYFQDVKKYQF